MPHEANHFTGWDQTNEDTLFDIAERLPQEADQYSNAGLWVVTIAEDRPTRRVIGEGRGPDVAAASEKAPTASAMGA